MTSTTSTLTINALRDICTRFGSMERLVTDNGPQFTSASFNAFCQGEGILHIRTAPYMPMSNGLAERFVSTFKTALAKSQSQSSQSIQEFLRAYRSTPNDRAPNGLSPAELLFGRRMRVPLSCVLPLKESTLPRDTPMEDQYNKKHGAIQRSFHAGERIIYRTKPDASWLSAQIIEPIGTTMHANQIRLDRSESLPMDLLLEDDPKELAPRKRNNPRAVTRSSPPVLRPRKRSN